jgi:recombination protein RecA
MSKDKEVSPAVKVKGFSLLKENPMYANPPGYLNTGNLFLNWAIANDASRGWPKGKTVELYGDPSTGKSLLATQALAQCQAEGGLAVLDDIEHAYSPEFGSKLGVDSDKLLIGSSKTVEECFSNLEKVMKQAFAAGYKDCCMVVDSLGQISSEHEMEVGFEKRDMTKAYLIRQGMRVLSPLVAEYGYLLIVLNHVTANIGDMFNPRTTTGGSGVKYGASVRVELAYAGRFPQQKEKPQTGVITKYKITKNRVAPPFRTGQFVISFSTGVAAASGACETLKTLGLLEPNRTPGFVSFVDDENTKYRRSTFDDEFEDIAKSRGYSGGVEFINSILSDPAAAEAVTVLEESTDAE